MLSNEVSAQASGRGFRVLSAKGAWLHGVLSNEASRGRGLRWDFGLCHQRAGLNGGVGLWMEAWLSEGAWPKGVGVAWAERW